MGVCSYAIAVDRLQGLMIVLNCTANIIAVRIIVEQFPFRTVVRGKLRHSR